MPFNLEDARRYWRFAPSGKGKVDTADLLKLDDAEFIASWRSHFETRLWNYWEDKFFVAYFCRVFSGKRVLSYGSGIGHNEIQFLAAGADLTCADIVPSNLDVILRVCRLLRVPKPKILYLDNPTATNFGHDLDAVFARGVMHHMPEADQIKVAENFRRAIKPEGQIVLNIYTRKYAERCAAPDDPTVFARASDPSVGTEHNPWSEWYDDAKVDRVFHLPIAQKRTWNDDLFCWYALAKDPRCVVPFPALTA